MSLFFMIVTKSLLSDSIASGVVGVNLRTASFFC